MCFLKLHVPEHICICFSSAFAEGEDHDTYVNSTLLFLPALFRYAKSVVERVRMHTEHWINKSAGSCLKYILTLPLHLSTT